MSDRDKTKESTVPAGGLSAGEVKERLAKYGYNEIPARKEGLATRLGKRFWGVVPWMLEATAVVTLLLGKYVDTGVIVFLLLFNAVMSLWREGKAKAAMAALKQRLRIQARVRRDGQWTIVPARELVPGDLVRVRMGDLLPADVKILDGSLGVDQSALTGESVNVEKSAGEIAYSGSSIRRGEATGLVDATGAKTYFGRTVELLELSKPKLHMEEVTVQVTRRLAAIVLASLLLVFVYAVLTGFPVEVLLPLAGVLLVASVPVAMPTMFTLNMALASSVLAKRGVLVTRLSASEDAAGMDVLCVDKTGTITINKLFVEEESLVEGFSRGDALFYGALASNEANQDPIDLAFIAAASEAGISLEGYTQTRFVPFDPNTRMTEATVKGPSGVFTVRKGAFDTVCSFCDLSDGDVRARRAKAEELSSRGLRVIAVAEGADPDKLRLVGLAGIADRIREDAREALDRIRGLDVSVKMLTGDSLPIARNVAGRMGLKGDVRTMTEIEEAQNLGKIDEIVDASGGIAEIYPEDKFTIVETLQRRGHVVGMMGDGINDAPALSQAEVGIAVKNATDIAKDSASAVLTAEGLGGIVEMIDVGRTIYERIYSWAFMMVSRKLHIVGYIVAMLLLTHSFMLSIFGTVLLLFLGDFVSMSISSDNVRVSSRPERFSVRRLFAVGSSLAVLNTVEGAALTLACFSLFGLAGDIDKIYTFGFAYLNISGVLTIMIVRERRRFWESRPSNFLLSTVTIEILFVAAIASLGFLEIASIGYAPVLAILGYTLVTSFLINDAVKAYLMARVKE